MPVKTMWTVHEPETPAAETKSPFSVRLRVYTWALSASKTVIVAEPAVMDEFCSTVACVPAFGHA